MLTMIILMVMIVLMMMVETMIARRCDDDHDDHDADGDDQNVQDPARNHICYDAWKCYVGFALRFDVWRPSGFRNRCEMDGSTPAFANSRSGAKPVGNLCETNDIDPRP